MSVFPVIPYCFLKDTIVLTNNGYKNIQDITFQDKLYSHTGKFQKINEIFIREHSNGKIINMDFRNLCKFNISDDLNIYNGVFYKFLIFYEEILLTQEYKIIIYS